MAESVIAAAALIGALNNGDREVLERRRLLEVQFGSVEDLAPSAVAALDRVLAKDSELLELWEDEGEALSLRNSVGGIVSPLQRIA